MLCIHYCVVTDQWNHGISLMYRIIHNIQCFIIRSKQSYREQGVKMPKRSVVMTKYAMHTIFWLVKQQILVLFIKYLKMGCKKVIPVLVMRENYGWTLKVFQFHHQHFLDNHRGCMKLTVTKPINLVSFGLIHQNVSWYTLSGVYWATVSSHNSVLHIEMVPNVRGISGFLTA